MKFEQTTQSCVSNVVGYLDKIYDISSRKFISDIDKELMKRYVLYVKQDINNILEELL